MSTERIKLPALSILSRVLDVNFDTGELWWKVRSPDLFETQVRSAEWLCKSWNGRFAGGLALTSVTSKGYHQGRILGITYQAHRIIYYMATGLQPKYIDHKNGIKTDNALLNLRAATPEGNATHSKLRGGASQYRGVHWQSQNKNWVATIRHNSKRHHIGSFADETLAAKAYDIEAFKHHGEFAALNFPRKEAL